MSTATPLEIASAKVQAAKDNFNRVLREEYPVDCRCVVAHGKSRMFCDVLDHDEYDCVEVRNVRSGKATWVHAWRLRGLYDPVTKLSDRRPRRRRSQ
jgi:hypothetical protein